AGPSKRAQQMIEEAKRLAQQQTQEQAPQQEPDND
ncbi:MAG: DnaT-like ssDNA-binding domain-containing protein, partial [Aeromonas sobria]